MNYSFYHGAALHRVIHDKKFDSIGLIFDNDTYLVNSSICLYLKHSSKRLSPWQFTFHQDHTDRMNQLEEKYPRLFVGLICGFNGVCCLSVKEYRILIHEDEIDNTKTIRTSRLARQKYKVTGSDGKLKGKIGDSDFPKKTFA